VTVLLVALAVVAVSLMVWFQVRDTRRVQRRRLDAVARAQEVLSDVEVTQDGIGYPTLRGRYGAHPAKVELVVDTLTMRRLPRLWLAVTVQRPTGVEMPVDVLLRPLSTDIVSPNGRFPCTHEPPAGWPVHLRVASPSPGALPPLGDVEELGDLLHEPETKDVLITSRGVRIVTELARGDVGPYRVTRRPDFRFVLEPSRLRRVLGDALSVAEALDRMSRRREVSC